ncbi:2357_t:CDS:2 [Ambispora gerdemannii]|uniref:2357_t:CDS:1 n=1 Tax=Ambispora gerdemannii TaxID=144530 RepID=A0A9N8ZPH1_9GLOM|nr:2357_t:CDS:2 [Ambispora gerdemannii]
MIACDFQKSTQKTYRNILILSYIQTEVIVSRRLPEYKCTTWPGYELPPGKGALL